MLRGEVGDSDHDHRHDGEPDDLPPQQRTATAPADEQRREGDQPAEADYGRPEIPLDLIPMVGKSYAYRSVAIPTSPAETPSRTFQSLPGSGPSG